MKVIAGFFGLFAVALGAFGAHALKERLGAADMSETWRIAVTYHVVHAVALYALANKSPSPRSGNKGDAWEKRAGGLWAAGTLLFSGSLYALALGGPRWLGPVTPFGGAALLGGWLCVIISGFCSAKNPDRS